MRENPIRATIDFEAEGVQHGFLKLPHSHDGSAWGSIMTPISQVKRGDGPTALLTGGNHGDEYEGPIALYELCSRLEEYEAAVTGRIIIVPAMNFPAFLAGRRTSPIDQGNLNRSFPGRPDGTVTEKIADYFQRKLLPLADYVLDIHSGGRTLNFVPFAAAHVLQDKEQQARCVAAMQAFNAPYGLMLMEIDAMGMYDSAAEEMGKTFVSTELGGGGSATAQSAAIARRGVRNILMHAGILVGEPELEPTILLEMPEEGSYITSESRGLVEFCVDLGESVRAGEPVVRVHDIERSGREPHVYRAEIDGLLAGRHYPGLVSLGDTLAVLAVPTG